VRYKPLKAAKSKLTLNRIDTSKRVGCLELEKVDFIPHNPKVVGSNPAAATIIAPNE